MLFSHEASRHICAHSAETDHSDFRVHKMFSSTMDFGRVCRELTECERQSRALALNVACRQLGTASPAGQLMASISSIQSSEPVPRRTTDPQRETKRSASLRQRVELAHVIRSPRSIRHDKLCACSQVRATSFTEAVAKHGQLTS